MMDELLFVMLVNGLVCMSMGVVLRVCINVGLMASRMRVINASVTFKLLYVIGVLLCVGLMIMFLRWFFMFVSEVVIVKIVMIFEVMVMLKLVLRVLFFFVGDSSTVISRKKWLFMLMMCFYVMCLGLMFKCMNLFCFFFVKLLGLVLLILSFFKRLNMMVENLRELFLVCGIKCFYSVLLFCVDLWNMCVFIVVVSKLFVMLMV